MGPGSTPRRIVIVFLIVIVATRWISTGGQQSGPTNSSSLSWSTTPSSVNISKMASLQRRRGNNTWRGPYYGGHRMSWAGRRPMSPLRREYRVEDFFWTGSGDGADDVEWVSRPDEHGLWWRTRTTTLVVTRTVIVSADDTVYVTPTVVTPWMDDSSSWYESSVAPTPVVTASPTDIFTSSASITIGPVEDTTTELVPVSPTPSLPSPVTYEPISPLDLKYWIRSVFQTNRSSGPSETELEDTLARIYSSAFRRQQERHLGLRSKRSTKQHPVTNMTIPVAVDVFNVSEARASDNNARIQSVIYAVFASGKPVLASKAVKDMQYVTEPEMESEFRSDRIQVLVKAEALVSDTQQEKAISESHSYWVIPVVMLGSVLLVLSGCLVVWGWKRIHNRKRQHREEAPESPRHSEPNGQVPSDFETVSPRPAPEHDIAPEEPPSGSREELVPSPSPKVDRSKLDTKADSSSTESEEESSLRSVFRGVRTRTFPKAPPLPPSLPECLDKRLSLVNPLERLSVEHFDVYPDQRAYFPQELSPRSPKRPQTAPSNRNHRIIRPPVTRDAAVDAQSSLEASAVEEDTEESEEVGPAMNRMRRRFHRLLDEAFSLFGSPRSTYEPDLADGHPHHSSMSGDTVSPTSKVGMTTPRKPPRPPSGLQTLRHPRRAWNEVSPLPTDTSAGTEGKRRSAEPQLPLSGRSVHFAMQYNQKGVTGRSVTIGEDDAGELPPNDPAVPLIQAIKEELKRFQPH